MNHQKIFDKIEKLGWITNDPDILKLTNGHSWTVAHAQAKRGWWTTDDPEILKLANKNGWTVAHVQAYYGWTTDNTEILKLADKNGWTVRDEQNNYKLHNTGTNNQCRG